MQVKHTYSVDPFRTMKQCFIIATIIVIGMVFISTETNATSMTVTQREVWFYKPISYSTKLQVTCENSFIGYEYRPELAKKCKLLWKKWTQEILNQYK